MAIDQIGEFDKGPLWKEEMKQLCLPVELDQFDHFIDARIMSLVGDIMAATKGKANPAQVLEKIRNLIPKGGAQ